MSSGQGTMHGSHLQGKGLIDQHCLDFPGQEIAESRSALKALQAGWAVGACVSIDWLSVARPSLARGKDEGAHAQGVGN